jgi:hypothetical protein
MAQTSADGALASTLSARCAGGGAISVGAVPLKDEGATGADDTDARGLWFGACGTSTPPHTMHRPTHGECGQGRDGGAVLVLWLVLLIVLVFALVTAFVLM